ncbi:MAG: hypothetical protein EOP11_01970 [Proteobacteria bacterium]|nr:MAG: hypothetical protein EOP11_01970 [Pseudomonadota bacterium]
MKLAIFSLLFCSLPAFAGGTLDRKLSKAEMVELLPAYVAFIDTKSAELPSPSDNQTLRMVARSMESFTRATFSEDKNGGLKIIGQESYELSSILGMMENALKEIKEVSTAERVANTNSMLEGFRDFRRAKRLRCRLGYSSEYKAATNRIVECSDDHSVAGSGKGDDEGYSDIRKFILSIDAKTLRPVGVLTLEHFLAG